MLPVIFPFMEPLFLDFIEPFFMDPDFMEPDFMEPDFIEPELMEPELMEPDVMFPELMVLCARAGAAVRATAAAAMATIFSMGISTPRQARGGATVRLSASQGNSK